MYSVYAAYDAAGALLYVGASMNVKPRLWQHSSKSVWGRDVAKVLTKGCPTKQKAFAMETRAIQILKPKYNISVRQGADRKYPIPTDAQVENIVKHWHSKMKRASVVEIVQDMMGAPVPDHWVRDQVIKATGSAKRSPQEEGSDGRG